MRMVKVINGITDWGEWVQFSPLPLTNNNKMKNKILILGIAISGLAMSQETVKLDSIIKDSIATKVVLDTTKITKIVVKTKVCGKNTSKNLPCKNKTKHESGCCHYHRD